MGSPNIQEPEIRRVLATNLKALLAERRLSQNQLAKRTGVSQKQVNNVCAQRTGCGIDVLYVLARELRVAPGRLLEPPVGMRERSAGLAP